MKLTKLQSDNLKSFKNQKSKIYYLNKILVSKKTDKSKIKGLISKHLNIIYQHVFNELNRKCKNPKENWDLDI